LSSEKVARHVKSGALYNCLQNLVFSLSVTALQIKAGFLSKTKKNIASISFEFTAEESLASNSREKINSLSFIHLCIALLTGNSSSSAKQLTLTFCKFLLPTHHPGLHALVHSISGSYYIGRLFLTGFRKKFSHFD
jgi:hypothetical protein